MSGADLAWIAGCIAFASFAQSLSGFGFSLLAVPLMTLVVSPRDAVVVATIIGMISIFVFLSCVISCTALRNIIRIS